MIVPYVTNAACWSGAALIRRGLDRFALREKVRRLLRGEPAPGAHVEALGAPQDEAEAARPAEAASSARAAAPASSSSA